MKPGFLKRKKNITRLWLEPFSVDDIWLYSVCHWWHLRLFPHFYISSLTFLEYITDCSTVCTRTGWNKHTLVWWRQQSEKHMNVCKFTLSYVFKLINEATLKPDSLRQCSIAHSGLLCSLIKSNKTLVGFRFYTVTV